MNEHPLIQARGLVKIHKIAGIEVVALQGLDLDVARGEFVALVGPSGAGKSTLLNAIAGLDRPDAGRLLVDGVDLLAISPTRLTAYRRRQVGVVWQQTARNLLPYLGARENIELLLALAGLPASERRLRAADLLIAVGMQEHAGRALAQLSGGQQQRVALACALAAHPSILLADEPTGELDWPNAWRTLDLLRDLRARYGLTILIVTHDERVAAQADRVVAIRDGQASGERSGTATGELTMLDSAGRLQIPASLRAQIGLGRRARITAVDNSLIISPGRSATPDLAPVPDELPDLARLLYPQREPISPQSMVELRDIERVYAGPGGGVHALCGVSLTLRPGEFIALSGPSGSGKTTLLNLVAGLDSPTAGSIRLLGADLGAQGETSRTALRRRIGLMFQSFALLPAASAYENVELGLRLARSVPRAEWDQRVRACLAAVGLTPWADHRPYELSGGQQQRVAIARALAPGPALIVADEPTGDLDPATAWRVLTLLRALAEQAGVAILIATHDPAAIAAAAGHYQLCDGVIVASSFSAPSHQQPQTPVVY